jgi:hypothetical protein
MSILFAVAAKIWLLKSGAGVPDAADLLNLTENAELQVAPKKIILPP